MDTSTAICFEKLSQHDHTTEPVTIATSFVRGALRNKAPALARVL